MRTKTRLSLKGVILIVILLLQFTAQMSSSIERIRGENLYLGKKITNEGFQFAAEYLASLFKRTIKYMDTNKIAIEKTPAVLLGLSGIEEEDLKFTKPCVDEFINNNYAYVNEQTDLIRKQNKQLFEDKTFNAEAGIKYDENLKQFYDSFTSKYVKSMVKCETTKKGFRFA